MADNTEEEEEKLKALLRFAQIGQTGSQDDFQEQEEEAFDPTAVAGLGLGGGIVASQTGGLPSTSQRLSPFAQKVAAADAARASNSSLIGQKPPQSSLNSAQGARGSSALPRQPSLGQASQAARASARQAAARNPNLLRFLLGRANLPLAVGTTSYGVGTVLNNTFGLSDKIANAIVGDSNQPAFTPEELGQGNQAINTASVAPTQLVPGIENITLPTTQYPEITFDQQARADGTQAYPFGSMPEKKPQAGLDQFLGTFMRAVTPKEELGYTPPTLGDVAAAAGIRSGKGEIFGSPGRKEARFGPANLEAETLPIGSIDVFPSSAQAKAPTPEATFTLPSGEVRTIMPGQSIPEAFGREDTGTRTFQVDGGSVTVPSNLAIQTLNLGEEAEARRAQQRFLQSPEARQMTNRMLQSVLNDPYAQASREREARLAERDLRPGETQTERDTRIAQSRTQGATTGGLKMSDAVELAGGDRDLARTMVVRSRMGMDPMTGKKEKEPFEPRVIEMGGRQFAQLTPDYYQILPEEPAPEVPFEPRSIEVDGETLYEVSPNRFSFKPRTSRDDDGPLFPTDSNAGTTEDIIQTDGDVQLPTVTDQASYEALQVGDKYLYEGKEYTKK